MVSLTVIHSIDLKNTGRMAEWNEVLVLGNSHFGGVGSSLSFVILLTFLHKVLFLVF